MIIKTQKSRFFLCLFCVLLLQPGSLPAQLVNKPVLNQVLFTGSFPFSPKTLIKAAGLTISKSIDRKQIAGYSTKLENFLYGNGYLHARIDSVRILPGADSEKISLNFYGNAGERTYFGSINVESDSIPALQYQNLISLNRGDPFMANRVDRTVRSFLDFAADSGYLFTEIAINKMKMMQKNGQTEVDVSFQIHEQKRIYIKNVYFSGNTYTKNQVLLRELPVQTGSYYSNKVIREIPQQLMRLGILKQVSEPKIIRVAPDSVSLEIKVSEGNATTFDGVVGYVPDKNTGGGYFSGLINLSFKNLFGSGRKFIVHWKKPDDLSEEFFIEYTEPWVFGYPIDLGGRLDRTVRDTTFIQWNYGLDFRMRLLQNLSVLGKLQKNMYIPDSAASHDFRLLQNEVINAQIGIEYDTRDYPINPRNGLFFLNTYTYGMKHNSGPTYVIQEDSLLKREDLHSVHVEMEVFYNLWSNQVLAMSLKGSQVKGTQLQLTDYFWFGGSRSLRGYRENQFKGSAVAISNLEYRFLLGRNTRFSLFTDWAYYSYDKKDETFEELLMGYGMGVRFETPLGILGVDLGLAKGDSFRDGKIHFGLMNQF